MSHKLQKESTDIDHPGRKEGSSPFRPKENGDKWVWKAGKRITVSGFFMDRYLYLPSRFRLAGQGRRFASRLSLEQYIYRHFPDVDFDAFFSSFSWKIPSKAFKRDQVTLDRHEILNVGICVLRESKKTSPHQLLNSIEKAMPKIEDEDSRDCIMDLPQPLSLIFDLRVESLKLEDEIDHVLNALRKSQELEYFLADKRLSIQKDHIINLYQQLDKERLELSLGAALKDQDLVLDSVLCRIEQIKRELSTLKDMEEVSKGFGRVSKQILEEQFGVGVKH